MIAARTSDKTVLYVELIKLLSLLSLLPSAAAEGLWVWAPRKRRKLGAPATISSMSFSGIFRSCEASFPTFGGFWVSGLELTDYLEITGRFMVHWVTETVRAHNESAGVYNLE